MTEIKSGVLCLLQVENREGGGGYIYFCENGVGFWVMKQSQEDLELFDFMKD